MDIILNAIDGNIWLSNQIILKKIANIFVFQYGSSLYILERANTIKQTLSCVENYLVYDYNKEGADKSVGYFKRYAARKLKIDLTSETRRVLEEISFYRFLFKLNQAFTIGSTSYYCLKETMRLTNEDKIDELDILVGCFNLWHFNRLYENGDEPDAD